MPKAMRVSGVLCRTCTTVMSELTPVVFEVMMDHPETLWGDAVYPVVK